MSLPPGAHYLGKIPRPPCGQTRASALALPNSRYQVIDLGMRTITELDPIPTSTFIHVTNGSVNVGWTGDHKTISAGCFGAVPAGLHRMHNSALTGARVILFTCTTAPAEEIDAAQTWSNVTELTQVEREAGIRLWSPYAATGLNPKIGYEYFAIGQCPGFQPNQCIPEVPEHSHPDSDAIVYILAGSGEWTVGGQTLRVRPGLCFRVPRGVPHSARVNPGEWHIATSAQDKAIGQHGYAF